MKEIYELLQRMSSAAAYMIYYGVKFAIGVLVLGIVVYFYNKRFLGNGVLNSEYALRIIQAAFSLFVQFIMGGLIFDCVKASGKG